MTYQKIGTIFGILLIFLWFRFFFFFIDQTDPEDGQYIFFETTLLTEPKIFGNTQRFNIRPEKIKGSVTIVTTRFPKLEYGKPLRIEGKVTKRIVNKKISYTMYFPKIESLPKSQHGLLWFLGLVRQKIRFLFRSTLPKDSASLLLGIVFGIRDDMSSKLTDSFRSLGLLHIVAASGMNISMVGGFLSSVFSYFLNRRLAVVLTIFGIFFYAVISGLEPSIVRAAIMGSITFTALVIGKQKLSWYSLILAGYCMLIISPKLVYDVGFQLSFLATAGLLFIRPIFERTEHMKKLVERSILGEAFITTFAAQLATLPILIYYFGTYSPLSILANTLVLWVIPYLMILGGFAVVFGMVFDILGMFFLYLCLPLLLYLENISLLFEGSYTSQFNTFPIALVFAYYSLLTAFVLWFLPKRASFNE